MQKIMGMKNQQGITTFWGISIILMVCVVVVFVFYFLYFFWIENPTPTSEITIVRAVRHQSVSIPSSVDTTGWLVYENSSFPMSFKYPATYKVNEDEVIYGTTSGTMISLMEGTVERFNLRIFPAKTEEAVPAAFQRITGIDPSSYQSFMEKIDGTEAVIYRQKAGTLNNDRIYFINGKYFYEAPYNASTVSVLSTFKFR